MEKPSFLRKLFRLLSRAIWAVIALATIFLGIIGYQLKQTRWPPDAGEIVLAVVLLVILAVAVKAAFVISSKLGR